MHHAGFTHTIKQLGASYVPYNEIIKPSQVRLTSNNFFFFILSESIVALIGIRYRFPRQVSEINSMS